jgi:uncharacterized protein (TIGR03067 family)
VRVPNEAGKGNAKVTLSFPDWKEGRVAPATVEVPLLGAPIAKDSRNEEAKKLQGTWQKEVVRYVIRGDTIMSSVDGEVKGKDTYEVDPNAKPPTIDLKMEKEGGVALGIYSLDGDTLTICWTERGKVRPKDFSSKPGSGFDLFVLKREKAAETDEEVIQGTWKVVDATWLGKKVEGTELGEKGVVRLGKWNLLFIFEGDKWETKALDKTESRGTFKLDHRKKPMTIDLRIADGEETHL